MVLRSPLKVLTFSFCMSENLKIYFLCIINEGLYIINW